MDKKFLTYYNIELQHLRESSGRFSKENPKIAARLGLDRFNCEDPYVERLLEGFAFLSARVHLKLDEEFPRFTHSIIHTVYPQYLMPTPSMAMVSFVPDLSDPDLAQGFRIPAETRLNSAIGKDEKTACRFQTAHDVTLYPLELKKSGLSNRLQGCHGIWRRHQSSGKFKIKAVIAPIHSHKSD